MSQHRATVTVVVCTASHERLALLRKCVDSLLAGTHRPEEIIVVVDQNPRLKADLAASLPVVVSVLETERQGNSEGRNVGIQNATTEVVAFVDDDAVVEPTWLERLMKVFDDDPAILGAGGQVVPCWEEDSSWMPDELLWTVGCTYAGHRQDAGPIRNPIGCNMAFRREALLEVGGFASEFGKRGNALVICDETELCLRLAERFGAGRIRYAPDARVIHYIPTARISPRALVHRALSEGFSKARLRRLYPDGALANETGYARRLLLRAMPLLLGRALRHRDMRSLRAAAAIAMTLGAAGGAFLAAVALPGVCESRLSR
jgi:GT2 family glycosyltransferase